VEESGGSSDAFLFMIFGSFISVLLNLLSPLLNAVFPASSSVHASISIRIRINSWLLPIPKQLNQLLLLKSGYSTSSLAWFNLRAGAISNLFSIALITFFF